MEEITIADIGLMLETALGYLATPQVSDEDTKKAYRHILTAQKMLFYIDTKIPQTLKDKE